MEPDRRQLVGAPSGNGLSEREVQRVLGKLLARWRDEWSVIAPELTIRGTVTTASRGLLEVRGRVEGDIDHGGQVLIAPGSVCVSNIRAAALVVAGAVHGDVEVRETLEIRPGGQLCGNAVYGHLLVHPGGAFAGTTHMALDAEPLPALLPAPAPVQALAPAKPPAPAVAAPDPRPEERAPARPRDELWTFQGSFLPGPASRLPGSA